MSYGTSISATKPTPQVTTDATAVQNIRDWMDEVQTRLEGKVTPAGMSINAALDVNSQELQNIDAAEFDDALATKTGAGNARKLYFVGDDLWVTDGTGTAIKFTSSSAINISSSGGFTGDYSSDANAEASYSTANTRYTFYSTTSTTHAKTRVGELEIVGTSASPTYGVTFDAPTLAANRTYTVPAAPPASAQVITMDSSGDMAVNGTIAGDLAISGDVSFTGDISYPEFTRAVSISGGFTQAASTVIEWAVNTTPYGYWGFTSSATTSDFLVIPIELNVGDRIKSITIWHSKHTTETFTFDLVEQGGTGSTASTDGNIVDTVTAGTGTYQDGYSTTISAIDHTVIPNHSLFLLVSLNTGSTITMRVTAVDMVWDRPLP